MNGRKEEEQNRMRRFAPCCLNQKPREQLPGTLPAALCRRHPSVCPAEASTAEERTAQ